MMDSQKIHITRFSGHVHEDPQKFLDELDSYLILHGIKVTSTDRKCAAFHLHLQGPALSWYQRLADTVKYNWNNLRAAFLAQYNNNRCFHIDVEKFHSLRLQPNQRIKDKIGGCWQRHHAPFHRGPPRPAGVFRSGRPTHRFGPGFWIRPVWRRKWLQEIWPSRAVAAHCCPRDLYYHTYGCCCHTALHWQPR